MNRFASSFDLQLDNLPTCQLLCIREDSGSGSPLNGTLTDLAQPH